VVPAIKDSEDTLTYLLTPQFKLNANVLAYGRYSTGFRPGTANQVSIGHPDVPLQSRGDKTASYELGLKGSLFDGHLGLDFSVYHIDINNIQLTLTQGGFLYNVNGGGAKSEGAEFSAIVKPIQGLTIDGWVSYDNAVLTSNFPAASTATGVSGDRLPNSSKWSGHVDLEQQFPVAGQISGFGGATVSYVGDRLGTFEATEVRQVYPAFTRLDVRLGARLQTWTTTFFINNVSDKRGEIGGGLGDFIPNEFAYITPRTIGLTVAKTF